jgi:hypothetical protein
VGTFTIRRGESVRVLPAPGVQPELLRLYLNGPVAAALLRQQGFLVLHGSAVGLGGGAVVFLGASGWGKSTLAAALEGHGRVVISDDVAAIDMTGTPRVVGSMAHLKLWPDTLTALGQNPDTLPRVHPRVEKRVRPVERLPQVEPFPLERVYVLADASTPAIEALAPGAALVELLRHSYGPRTLQHVRREEHFRHCARIAGEIAIARLSVPRDFARLDQVAGLVERDSTGAP